MRGEKQKCPPAEVVGPALRQMQYLDEDNPLIQAPCTLLSVLLQRVDSNYAVSSTRHTAMNYRMFLMGGMACLFLCLTNSQIKAAETPLSGARDHATIYFSAAPWDGAAYDIEIPLEHTKDASQPFIRIIIWGNPEFPEPTTFYFSGKEDPGGGPFRGSGRASFQTILNKSWPENLAGSVSFKALQRDYPVSGVYELATLDGKKKFKGNFQAAWGNKPLQVIR